MLAYAWARDSWAFLTPPGGAFPQRFQEHRSGAIVAREEVEDEIVALARVRFPGPRLGGAGAAVRVRASDASGGASVRAGSRGRGRGWGRRPRRLRGERRGDLRAAGPPLSQRRDGDLHGRPRDEPS